MASAERSFPEDRSHPTPVPSYDLQEFCDLLSKQPDILSSHPCVVRGFVERWPAARTWTSLEALAKTFGSLPVTAGAPQFTTNRHSTMCQVKTDFGTYLEYVAAPERLEELFEGRWVKGDAGTLARLGMPLYCGNLRLVRHAREEVLKQISPPLPQSMECLNDEIPYYHQSGNHVWLYVSLARALTPLHQDNNNVIAYLAQLQGHKEAILYSPDDKEHFHNPDVGYMDPLDPDDGDFPTWRQARPWTASLHPGELLIWGADWAHHVRTMSTSITVSFDVVNASNLVGYARSSDWRHELGRFARANADLIRKRMPDAAMQAALTDADEGDLGKAVMVRVLRAALATPLSEQSRMVKSRMLEVLDEDGRDEALCSRTPQLPPVAPDAVAGW